MSSTDERMPLLGNGKPHKGCKLSSALLFCRSFSRVCLCACVGASGVLYLVGILGGDNAIAGQRIQKNQKVVSSVVKRENGNRYLYGQLHKVQGNFARPVAKTPYALWANKGEKGDDGYMRVACVCMCVYMCVCLVLSCLFKKQEKKRQLTRR